MRYFSADLALTPSFCPVWYTVAGYIRALLSASWLIFHNDIYLQRNLVTRYAMLRKSHTISRLGLRANKGMEQRRLGSSLKSRMGTRPLKFFWVTTSRVPMLWKGKKLGERKRKGEKERKNKKERKRHMRWGLPQKYGEKGEPKDKIKKKKKWNEPQQKEKGDAEKCGQKTKQNQHSHRKRRGEEKWR